MHHPDLTWTAQLAYVVGLITTDGNLSSDGRHMSLVSKDKEQIQLLKDLLNLGNQITKVTSTYGPDKVYWRIQFGSVIMYNWLLDIGLVPNKSKVLTELKIPDHYFFDFLRGHIDGDGSFDVYNDPAFPRSRRLYVLMNAANLPHLEWIQATLQRLIGISGYVKNCVREWRLCYAKRESLVLLPQLYHSPDVPCLKRKRDLIEEFLG